MNTKWRWLTLLILTAGCTSTPTPGLPSESPPTDETASETSTWIRTFEGDEYGALFDLALTPDGDVVVVGTTNHLHVAPYSGDALVMKLSLEGDVLWERTWGGDGYEQAWSVVTAADGGFLIFGETDSYGSGDRDFFLLKLTDDGTEQWVQTYGGSSREWPYEMLLLSNGDLLLVGFSHSPESGRDQYALRVSQEGDVIWEYISRVGGEDIALDAIETAEGDLILVVSIEEDGQLVSLDADGHLQWEQRYELPGWQFASQIASSGDGGFLLAGFSMSGSSRQADTWLARCASTGELEWETSIGDPGFDDYANSFIRLRDGSYVIGAIANGMLLRHIDEQGEILWERSLVGTGVYGAMELLELDDGGFLIAGLIQLINARSYDAILVRTNADGWVVE